MQDNRGASDRQRRPHLLVKGTEIAGLQARRSGKHLKLRLDRSELAIYTGKETPDSLPDVTLDLSAAVIDHSEHGYARERDQGEHGNEGQQREPRLNTQSMTTPQDPCHSSDTRGRQCAAISLENHQGHDLRGCIEKRL